MPEPEAAAPAAAAGFRWTWLGIGILVLLGLNVGVGELSDLIIASRFGLQAWGVWLGVFLGLYLATFFVGGLVIGRLSPGLTLREPAWAALISVVGGTVVASLRGRFPGEPITTVLVGGLGFGLALAGAYLGERWQARAAGRARGP